jgi:hypothetical protein
MSLFQQFLLQLLTVLSECVYAFIELLFLLGEQLDLCPQPFTGLAFQTD